MSVYLEIGYFKLEKNTMVQNGRKLFFFYIIAYFFFSFISSVPHFKTVNKNESKVQKL